MGILRQDQRMRYIGCDFHFTGVEHTENIGGLGTVDGGRLVCFPEQGERSIGIRLQVELSKKMCHSHSLHHQHGFLSLSQQ